MRGLPLVFLLLLSVVVHGQHVTNTGILIVNSQTISTNGEWTNAVGSVLQNNGQIITSDNFINNGNLSGTGIFVLNYSTDKNFKSGSPLVGALVKNGAGALLLNGSIHVTDSLVLNQGLVKLGALDTVWIRGGIVKASAGSYIEGAIAHSGQGDKLFPFGRDGYFLPMHLIKFNATKATAVVVPAPTGYTAGPGVEALIAFPYVWKVAEKVAADTSAYVEVSYPNTLPTATNPIVTQEIPGSKYASMGARLIDNTGGRVTVRSYSRGLKGTFTVARGFPGNFRTDSLALVSLYNSTGGTAWTSRSNWLTGNVSQWFGVTVTGQSITAVNLPNNRLTGAVPDPLVDILSLQTINLSNNSLTAIPNFNDNQQVTTLNVSNNKLEFSSLEPNKHFVNAAGITFNYSNQGDIGQPATTQVDVGTNYTVTAQTSGTNAYQWKRNGTNVTGATSRSYDITAIKRDNMGSYVCEVTNTFFPGLLIKTAPNNVLATATMDGKLLATSTDPATKGKVTLLRITQANGYDTISVKNINTDGTYRFEKVVLDDYQLLGFVDTVTYARALPTYYTNTILWEEAQTVALNANANDLDITTNYKPSSPPVGTGVISGTITESVAGGRGQSERRVKGAGAMVRKVERTGRGEGETLTLVAYVFSNDDGEFVLPKLAKGEYRLNIQYPGYPMDETSYVTIPIGDGLQSQVKVSANVADGKIKVKKLIVTGIWEQENYVAEAYPNPSTEYVHLRFNNTLSGREATIVDVTGKTWQRQAVSEREAKIDVRTLPSGVYILQVMEDNQVMKSIRIMKE